MIEAPKIGQNATTPAYTPEKYFMLRLLTTTLLLLTFSLLHAQQHKTCTVAADTAWQTIDSLTILPYSMQVRLLPQGETLPDSLWEVSNRQFRLLPAAFRQNTPDSVYLQYLSLAYDLSAPMSFFDSAEVQQIEGGILHSIHDRPEGQSGYALPTENSGLRYTGDFSRGISLGNNQNLSLNSGFHLQMNGLIGNGIKLRAAITDENLPIQAEGNTQQLREFDRIYIQIEKDKRQLTLGDYRLQHLPEGYFMRFDKKLEGASYRQNLQLSDKSKGQVQLSTAINRGKFTRHVFNGQEGNQGPYRLQGAEGETFVIILSGTERIYLDGKLLTRGADADYVIDYNRGELTFTHRHLITAQSRITAEYEYNDNRYLRSIYAFQTDWQTGKSQWQFQWLSQQDSRSRNSDELLTDEQYQILVQAGDDPLKAVVSGLDSSNTASDPIRYRLIDTLVNGQLYSVLKWTADGSGPYTVRFSELGPGQGNYTRLDNTANGIVYAWVAPDSSGTPQGNYEPVLRLIPPRQHQLFTLRGQQSLGKNGSLSLETALSRKDDNRFSNLDKDDDLGLGLQLQYQQKIPLGKKWQLQIKTQAETIGQKFRALNPYRPVEFGRDWNTSGLAASRETLTSTQVGLLNQNLKLQWRTESLHRGDSYRGFRQTPSLQWNTSLWQITASGNYLQSKGENIDTKFNRTAAKTKRTFSKIGNSSLEFQLLTESNTHLPKGSDTLSELSNGFEEYGLYWNTPENKNFTTRLGYIYRLDDLPKGQTLSPVTRAHQWLAEGHWKVQQKNRYRSQFNWNLSYRRLLPLQNDTAETIETYLGRINWQWSLAKGSIQGSSAYQIGSGREQKLLFVYKAVNPGEGIYQHIDFNGDGIEQNNEFVIAANPDEATHLRIAVFTGEFLPTNNLSFSQNLRIRPRAVWRKQKGLRGLLSLFTITSNLQIDRKLPRQGEFPAWNPFLFKLPDTSFITLNLRQQQLVEIRQNKWGAHWQYNSLNSRILLTTGFENRNLQQHEFQIRWTPSSQWRLKGLLKTGQRGLETENFHDRNHLIAFRQITPEINWNPSKSWRLTASWMGETAQNRLAEEKLQSRTVKATINFRLSNLSTLTAELSNIQITFSGEPASPAGFAMLNGLLPGNNWRWSLILEQELPNNLRLSLLYNGRKSENIRIVHTGQARLTALF